MFGGKQLTAILNELREIRKEQAIMSGKITDLDAALLNLETGVQKLGADLTAKIASGADVTAEIARVNAVEIT